MEKRPLIELADLNEVDLEAMKKNELIDFIKQQNSLYKIVSDSALETINKNKELEFDLKEARERNRTMENYNEQARTMLTALIESWETY